MSEKIYNRRAFIRIGASGLGSAMLNWSSFANASGKINYLQLQQFKLKVPEWVVYNDGSFDLITDSVMLKGCRPAIDGQAIMSKNVFLGDSPKGKRVVYELQNGFLMVDLKINNDSASISAELSGFKNTPEWFYPISHAKIENADSFYKQGLLFDHHTGITQLSNTNQLIPGDPNKTGNWSHDSYLTFALFNKKDTLAVGTFEHNAFMHRSTIYNRSHQQEILNLTSDPDFLYFESGFLMESIPLSNDFIKLPDIHFIFGNKPFKTLQHLSWEISKISGARNGLCSCYHWSHHKSQSRAFSFNDLKGQLDFLKTLKPQIPFQAIQIDDGYCIHGDWLDPNENWPGGLDRAAREIYQYGYKAGINIAPFKVDENSNLFRKHPDWMVKGRNNRPLPKQLISGAKQYILDTTHPGAQNYIRKVFRTLRKMGFTFYKTSHMDWGLRDSSMMKRANPRYTSMQIYRNILAIIRKEMGIGSFWLCSDTPLPAAIGFADGMLMNDQGQLSWLKNNIPKTINDYYFAHYYNNIFWQNDPGIISLNNKHSELSEDEKISIALWNGIMGGTISTTDTTEAWTEKQKELFRFLEPSDRPNNALLPFWPSITEIKVAAKKYVPPGGWGVLFFNDKDTVVHKTYDITELIGEDRMYIFSWMPAETKYLGKKGKIEVKLQPHQSQLFYLSKSNTPPPKGLTLGGKLPEEPTSGSKKTTKLLSITKK
ncbi:hypothetical protein MNBD_BACTEROID01-907 [hydrothermal vent metagenome]|uniref:Alpha-galactosidase n=1 Tax=hydrothermal vent metagenome TaxID=652676 RepID=A0A3B0U1T8_9ZZZZ